MTRLAIDKNRITFVILLSVMAAGVASYKNLPRAEDPGFTIRTAQIVTYLPGASPERIEQLVTDPIEEIIQTMPEVESIDSRSRVGVSVVMVNVFESEPEMRPIWDLLRRKIDEVALDLPDGTSVPFVNDEFGDVFGIVLSLTAEGMTYREIEDIADEVKDQLLRIPDMAKVQYWGTQEERVFVEYDNARLAEVGLSPQQLSQRLSDVNILLPGGRVVVGNNRLILEPSGNFESVRDLRRTLIPIPGGSVMFLEDLANVRRGYIDPAVTHMTSSGTRCIGIYMSMKEGGNLIALGANVRQTMARLQGAYPIGVEFSEIAFLPDVVEKKVNNFMVNLGQAIVIVFLSMLVFLGLRTGLVVASLVPMAMIMALFLMSLINMGLDQISLAALIIALGLLVDNAIVISETVMVRMQAGEEAREAAIASANELAVPLLTSTLTTAAAFLPIYMAQSNMGEYTGPLFVVVLLTLLSSWTLAITVIPLLCVMFLKVKLAGPPTFDSAFYKVYRAMLTFIVKNRLVSGVIVIAMFAGSCYGFTYVKVQFMPASDKPMFTFAIELPPGTPIERTTEVVAVIDQHIADTYLVEAPEDPEAEPAEEGILFWGSFIGSGLPRFYLPAEPEDTKENYAILLLTATSRAATVPIIDELRAWVVEEFPDVYPTIRPLEMGTPISAPIEVRVLGPDMELLFDKVDEVTAWLQAHPAIRSVNNDWGMRAKTLVVQVDQTAAAAARVTSSDIATSLQTVLSGLTTTEYREENKAIPVDLRTEASARQDIAKLFTMNIFAQSTGESVPLGQVADLVLRFDPETIFRRDRQRAVMIQAQLQPGYTAGDVQADLFPYMSELAGQWPIGYGYEYGGDYESQQKAVPKIMAQMPLAFFIILILLVGQFNSIRRPLIIILTIPLGVIGITAGMLLTGVVFSFFGLLGVIALSGIIINNAIVLIDRFRIEIDDFNRTPQDAIIMAAQQRLRPILLTTVTTVGGLIPLWLGGGPMFEPLAVGMIFGLLFATVLTLAVVPLLYSALFNVKFKGYKYAIVIPSGGEVTSDAIDVEEPESDAEASADEDDDS